MKTGIVNISESFQDINWDGSGPGWRPRETPAKGKKLLGQQGERLKDGVHPTILFLVICHEVRLHQGLPIHHLAFRSAWRRTR